MRRRRLTIARIYQSIHLCCPPSLDSQLLVYPETSTGNGWRCKGWERLGLNSMQNVQPVNSKLTWQLTIRFSRKFSEKEKVRLKLKSYVVTWMSQLSSNAAVRECPLPVDLNVKAHKCWFGLKFACAQARNHGRERNETIPKCDNILMS